LSAALDLARYAVGHSGPDELGVTEVGQLVNALRAAVLQQEGRVRAIFRKTTAGASENDSCRRVEIP
jgi:hypothetical protein